MSIFNVQFYLNTNSQFWKSLSPLKRVLVQRDWNLVWVYHKCIILSARMLLWTPIRRMLLDLLGWCSLTQFSLDEWSCLWEGWMSWGCCLRLWNVTFCWRFFCFVFPVWRPALSMGELDSWLKVHSISHFPHRCPHSLCSYCWC